jgi:hypothetical protein
MGVSTAAIRDVDSIKRNLMECSDSSFVADT